ncbi:transposase [Pseudovibrio sp. POLY-S9]|uniref:transposase n=1 Tax=Pseudovibrio sp. POLY-S9 TaxID=1576596 RepID=UPI00070DD276|nr:transposase [Pseudovibrio sp. POLY-S9]
MTEKRKFERRSAEEKQEMCRQALEPGASVKEVARRHGEHASQLHRWLNDPRYRPTSRAVDGFLSIDVSPEGNADGTGPTASSRVGGLNETSVRRLCVTLPCGTQLALSGSFSLCDIAVLAKELER